MRRIIIQEVSTHIITVGKITSYPLDSDLDSDNCKVNFAPSKSYEVLSELLSSVCEFLNNLILIDPTLMICLKVDDSFTYVNLWPRQF